MPTLMEYWNIIEGEGDLWKKAEAAICITATDILAESPSTNNHAARLVWANEVLANPKTWIATHKYIMAGMYWVYTAGDAITDVQMQATANACAPSIA